MDLTTPFRLWINAPLLERPESIYFVFLKREKRRKEKKREERRKEKRRKKKRREKKGKKKRKK